MPLRNEIGEDRPRVVQLVRRRDENDILRFALKPHEIGPLPREPWRFGDHLGIAQAEHHRNDLVAESQADFDLGRLLRLVLDSVVKHGGDRLIFGPAPFDHRAGDDQQMANIGNLSTLARLVPVKLGRVNEGILETLPSGRLSYICRFLPLDVRYGVERPGISISMS